MRRRRLWGVSWKTQKSRIYQQVRNVGFCRRPQLNPRLTSSFADVSSFVLTFIIVPVAVVDINGQTVFTEIVVWVSCKKTRDDLSFCLRTNFLICIFSIFFLISLKTNCLIPKASHRSLSTCSKKPCRANTCSPADESEGGTVHPLPTAFGDGVMAAHPQRDSGGTVLDHTWCPTVKKKTHTQLVPKCQTSTFRL